VTRLNTAYIFNFNLLQKDYKSIFDNDDFVNRCDHYLSIVYREVLRKALEERKYFDNLGTQGINISDSGIDQLVAFLLKAPAASQVLAEELETPLGSILKLEAVLQRIVVNKLIQVKMDPNKFAESIKTLEWNHETESHEDWKEVQFVSEQKSIPADLASPKDEKSVDFTLVNYEEPKVPNKLLSSLRALKAQTGREVNPHLVKGKGTKEDPFEID
jgi:hypothetical protein